MKKILFTLILLFSPLFVRADITTGLTHYYSMDEGTGTTITDTGSGTQANGTFAGSPAPTWAAPKIGFHGIQNTGSSGRVNISTSASLFNAGAGAYSVSIWVNYYEISNCPSSTDNCAFVSSLGNGGSGNQGDFFFGVQPDGRIGFANFQASGSGVSQCRSDLSTPLTINGWHHMVATWDTSNCVIYMDGTAMTQASISFTGSGDTLGTYIGIMYSGAAQYFSKAAFDDLRIYNRALSSADVTQLYAYDSAKRIFLTSGTSWSPPTDWNNSSNLVEVIGGGAGGQAAGNPSFGGGGGGYCAAANVSVSGSATYQVGAGGTATNNGTDTWFNGASLGASSVGAKAGLAAGTGGSSASGVGSLCYSGGNGGTTNYSVTPLAAGGGAAGPNGAGAKGGDQSNQHFGGGGGGAANGGSVGANTSAGDFGDNGAAGGANRLGLGAGTAGGGGGNGGNGTLGGGGGGAGNAATGGNGSMESLWVQTSNAATAGPGSGGGGTFFSVTGAAGTGATYGGGGGGNAAGAQGIILITYTPSSATPTALLPRIIIMARMIFNPGYQFIFK